MGKASKAAAEASTAKSNPRANATPASHKKAAEEVAAEPQDFFGVIAGAVPPIAALVGIAWGVGEFQVLHSASEGRTHFLARLLFYLLFDAAFARTFASLCVIVARWVARRLPGAVVPASAAACLKEEA